MRRASVVIAIASVVIPAACVFLTMVDVERDVQARGGPICGMPALANFILASLVSVLLSGVAFVLGAIAYRRLSPPRPRRRLLELAALTLPLLIVGGYVANLLLSL